jgi:hypothetical protein
MGLNDRKSGKAFLDYALFLSGACHDPRACRGIERKCYPAFDPGWLPGDSTAIGEVFLGKPEFEALPRVWWWMLS